MSCNGSTSCTCGCCAGVGVQTPREVSNLPGLSSIAYRTGTWTTFRESMHARLSSFDYPALAPLKTRASDDFTIALLDATAVMLDVLTFYQERLANESYLRTAVELRSVTELARLVDYRPTPGVAASAYLAFTLTSTPGLTPDPATPAITIPAGTQAQSIPAQGQTPQIFETSAPIQAKADWNAQPVQTGTAWIPAIGDTSVYLAGTSTQLQPGDLILIVGDEGSGGNWEVRLLTTVTRDTINKRALVEWNAGLTSVPAVEKHLAVYADRQRAALFGYSAVDPNLLTITTGNNLANLIDHTTDPTKWTWRLPDLPPPPGYIDLDSVYPKIVTGSWLVLTGSAGPCLYRATSVSSVARSGFGLSAKITRVVPYPTPGPDSFPLSTTIVFAQTDELDAAEQPFNYPLYGTYLDLETPRPDLAGVTVVAVSGKRKKIAVRRSSPPLTFVPDDESGSVSLNPGDLLTIMDPTSLPLNQNGSIPDWSSATTMLHLSVQDSNGRPGSVHRSEERRVGKE